MIDTLLALIQTYPYLVLFGGMLIAGETFLLPALYIALGGGLSLPLVVLTAISATLIADAVWYGVGRMIPLERIIQWTIFRKRKGVFHALERLHDRHGVRIVFASKFVYGTRTAAQILAGAHHVPFGRYLVANTLGVAGLLALIILIGILLAETLVSLKDIVYGTQIAFLAFIVVVILAQVWIKHWIQKRFRW